jgi:hypothetical protein
MSRHQNTGHSHNILVANKAFKNVVAKFKYFGRIVTNESCIHEEIKNSFWEQGAEKNIWT